jgi:hypothetical protein
MTREHFGTPARIRAVEHLPRGQAIWLARGAALGTLVGRLLDTPLASGLGLLWHRGWARFDGAPNAWNSCSQRRTSKVLKQITSSGTKSGEPV